MERTHQKQSGKPAKMTCLLADCLTVHHLALSIKTSCDAVAYKLHRSPNVFFCPLETAIILSAKLRRSFVELMSIPDLATQAAFCFGPFLEGFFWDWRL